MKGTTRTAAHVVGVLAAVLAAPPAVRADDGLRIELNKLEPRSGACRAYLLFKNGTNRTFSDFRLDLVLFDHDGIIANRLAVNIAPLRAGKTNVKLFDIDGMECASIGRVLVNDVIACKDEEGEQADCVTLIAPASRAKAPLVM